MDVVIRTPHGEAEITIARAGEATAIADIVERVTGSASPPIADVDGRAVLTTATIGSSGVVTGSVIDLGATTRAAPQDAVLELVQVAGWGAGARQAARAGHVSGRARAGGSTPPTSISPTSTRSPSSSRSTADGVAMVTVDEQAVRIDGIGSRRARRRGPPASSTSPAGRSCSTAASDGTILRRRRSAPSHPASWCSTARRDRPERPRRRRSPSPMDLAATVRAERPPRHDRRARRFDPVDQHVHAAFRADVVARRSAERERRHDLFPHVAGAIRVGRHHVTPAVVDTSRTTTDAFEFAIGLGDIEWRPELRPATTHPIEIAESIVAELGPLPMVPVTVDLARRARHGVRGLERVHAGGRSRVARRGVRPTWPRRSRRGRPHRSRSGTGLGVGQMATAQSHVGRRPGARRPRSGRRLGGIHPRTAARSRLDPTT